MTKYSVVIPVYKSANIVGQTIDQTIAFFEETNLAYELILINDGSPDHSWDVLREKAQANSNISAINFLRNYGQHTAVFCGLQHSTGDYVITMDDDLQNPPQEIVHLIEKSKKGHDLVFGQFRVKQHAGYRRLGTWVIGEINKRIFHKPDDLVLSNFRLIRHDVVERMCGYRTSYPYIPGLALMFSANPANVVVEHKPRPVGQSNYNLLKIAELVMRILFNYSSYPLRLVSFIGGLIAVFSFLLGIYFVVKALFFGTSVQGWASVVVLLSFFNGVVILILSMLGEYTSRLLQQTSQAQSYTIREIIRINE
jgi:glycosyltransferase involved in cell wall biosynthesis